MRSDIVPGSVFPDYQLPDHTEKLTRLVLGSAVRG